MYLHTTTITLLLTCSILPNIATFAQFNVIHIIFYAQIKKSLDTKITCAMIEINSLGISSVVSTSTKAIILSTCLHKVFSLKEKIKINIWINCNW